MWGFMSNEQKGLWEPLGCSQEMMTAVFPLLSHTMPQTVPTLSLKKTIRYFL